MITMTSQILIVLAAALLLMFVMWLIQLRTGNAGIVDVAWGAAIGGAVLTFAVLADGHPWRRVLVAGLTLAWSARLTYHLYRRVVGEEEDGRYKNMREWAGEKANAVFLVFFGLQATWVVLFSLPQLIVMQSDRPLRWLDGVAVVIFLISWIGESIADRQLAAWRSNPANKGKTCRAGLWRYSRHPNYFFEWLHWFAYCAMGIGIAYGWVTLLGPVLMLLFLLFVTGIPYTEMQAVKSRGDDYRRYQKTTSPFIPWFTKEEPA